MTICDEFERWFGGSKYTQVVYPSAATKQICLDGWQACAAHYEAELLKRDALIAEKDKALDKFAKGPMRPMPDPGAHSWEAFGKAWMEYATDCKFAAIHALSLTHDSVRLVEVAEFQGMFTTPKGTKEFFGWMLADDPPKPNSKLYTIVKGEAG